jgi:SNF2 family DNA or RNA helicase
MKLRDYQKEIKNEGLKILHKHRILYLSMEVRTGKTLTSLSICNELNVNNVLFITKKKAIPSIQDDFDKTNFSWNIWVINYESLHKMPDVKWDVVICDEAHSMGAFAKPNKRAKQVKDLISYSNPYYILLSGTPTPESYSQIYHQVYGHPNNPFNKHKSFYSFAKTYVDVRQRLINSMLINDYTRAKDEVIEMMKPITISYTQKEAGFKVKMIEKVLRVEMNPQTYILADKLSKELVIQGKEQVILAETAVKLMQKLHQIYSGTVKFESGDSMILDLSKANFIKNKFKNKKIGIFYKFKEELNALKEVYKDDLVTELSSFDDSEGKVIALQIVSGREGISLRQAEALVYYNIDFSATSYWQSRDRMTTKDRLHNDIYWVFSQRGIEDKIYKAVVKKKDYTLRHFKKDYGVSKV